MEATDTAPAPDTFPTSEQITALGMVGRVVTDGARVGIARMIEGPDWIAATNGDRSEARLIAAPPVNWHSPGPVAMVRWHGTEHLDAIPMGRLSRGVTLAKRH